jgi:cytochrome c oxidase subunit II
MFGGASNLAEGVDNAFVFIFAVSFFFIIGLSALMIYIVIRFRRSKNKEAMQFSGNNTLEVVWTVIPLILVMLMFYYGWVGFAPMRNVPDDAMRIKAIGRMWEWEFDYGDGKLSKTLVLPVNKPVRLDLVSEDVNHSLFIPAFRVKEDVVPGYNNWLWFTPIYIGEYDIMCTEYCGLLHYDMVTKASIVEQEEFDHWLENLEATGLIPDPPGLAVLRQNGCMACHSLDGRNLVGPSFKGLYNFERVVLIGREEHTIIADDDYIVRAIYQPDAEIVKGYNRGLMQSYEKLITPEEIKLIIDYLKTLDAN